MSKIVFILLSFLCLKKVAAQHKVTFHISSLPAYHNASSPIFLAGSFNNWNPNDKEFSFSNAGAKGYEVTLNLPKGKYEYKLTRGSWATAECEQGGMIKENRQLVVNGDATVTLDVNHWADHFPAPAKKSTANKNVHIIDTSFFIPQLNRHRRIWIYLPTNYSSSHKKYPVLYMHDGQNLFDDATSYSGEWGVDEALDTLGPQTKECIVVGIDNGLDKRLNEYSPYDMEKYGKGEGDAYVDFLVKTLKPYVDKKYRTKRGRKNRFVAGSSMGGLISFYAILKYPKVFGGAGVFSPAFWIVPPLKTVVQAKAKKVRGKIYFYSGMQEGETMVPDMLFVLEQMSTHSKAKMTSVIRSQGKHNEATWRQEFPLFYKWMMR